MDNDKEDLVIKNIMRPLLQNLLITDFYAYFLPIYRLAIEKLLRKKKKEGHEKFTSLELLNLRIH